MSFTVTMRHLKMALAALLAILLVVWLSSCIGRASTQPVAQQAQQPYAVAPAEQPSPQPAAPAYIPQPQAVYAPAPVAAPAANSGLHDMVTGALLGHVLTNAFSNRGSGGGGGDSTINRTVVNKTVVHQTIVQPPAAPRPVPAYVPPPRPMPAYTPPPRPTPTFSSPVRTAPSSWSAPSRPSTTSSFSSRRK